MINKYVLNILPSNKKVTGRIIGFIDTNTTNAVINTIGAPRKIFTAESVELGKGAELRGVALKRLVFATTGLISKCDHEVFISPTIRHIISIRRNGKNGVEFICSKDMRYELFPEDPIYEKDAGETKAPK